MSAFCRDMEQKFKLEEVLSPTKFLREEMRQIPRSDTRKSAMKNDVKACLISSKNYNEFQASMKARNYDVIRGRGIAFIDSKGVYAKGSELGYSLATIEKILQLSLHQKQTLFIKARPKGFLQKNTPNYGQR